MTRVITIRLEVPEGVAVRVGSSPPDDDEDEPLPSPWRLPPEPFAASAAVTGGRNGTAPGSCPIHHAAWRTVPGGISRKSGRAYGPFLACPAPGCQERPA